MELLLLRKAPAHRSAPLCSASAGRVAFVFAALLIAMLAFLLALAPSPALAESSTSSRKIDIVYDTSGSMFRSKDNVVVDRDTWCKAKYSVEVVAGMLGENASVTVYDTSSDKPAKTVNIKGSQSLEERIGTIHNWIPPHTATAFEHVRTASKDLQASKADQKWLVVFTDGEFQEGDNKKNATDIASELAGVAKQGVNVVYMTIGVPGEQTTELEPKFFGGAEVVNLQNVDREAATQSKDGVIYLASARDSNEILAIMQRIASVVSGRHTISEGSDTKEFHTDTSMKDVVVFAQGAGAQVLSLKGPNGQIKPTTAGKVRFSEVPASNLKGKQFDGKFIDRSLEGTIATFSGDGLTPGDYVLDFSGTQNLSIYYQPDINVALSLKDSETGVTRQYGAGKDDILLAGESLASFGLYDGKSGKLITNLSQLGDVGYGAVFEYENGERVDVSDGESIRLREGKVNLHVTANVLGDTTVSQSYEGAEVRTPFKIGLKLNGPTAFSISDIASFPLPPNPPEYEATVTLADGSPLNADQWAALEDLRIVGSDENITWVAEPSKEAQAPVVKLHPEFTPVNWWNKLPFRFWEVLGVLPTFADIGALGTNDVGVDANLFYDAQPGAAHDEMTVRVGPPAGPGFLINLIILIALLVFILWRLLLFITRKRVCDAKLRVEYVADEATEVQKKAASGTASPTFARKRHFWQVPGRALETRVCNSSFNAGKASGHISVEMVGTKGFRSRKSRVVKFDVDNLGCLADQTLEFVPEIKPGKNKILGNSPIVARYTLTHTANGVSYTDKLTIKIEKKRKRSSGKKGKKETGKKKGKKRK